MNNISTIPTGTLGASARIESYAGVRSRAATVGEAPASLERTDRVELSDEARALASAPTPIRSDLVSRVRAEIAAGTYETDEKLDSALNELAKDLGHLDLNA